MLKIDTIENVETIVVNPEDVIVIHMKEYNDHVKQLFNRLHADFPNNKIIAISDFAGKFEITNKETAIEILESFLKGLKGDN